MGASLLQIMADCSLAPESQVCAVTELVKSVQQLVNVSPDARQFRQVLVKAAAEYHNARPTTQQTTDCTNYASGTAMSPSDTSLEAASYIATRQQAPTHGTWVWKGVQDVVVLGLGSFGTYSTLLSTGKQTVAESTRAAPRLYQLALALSLPSLLQPDIPPTIPSNRRFPEPNIASQASTPTSSPQSTLSPDSQGTPDKQDPPATHAATVRFYDPAFDAFDLSLLHDLGCEAGTSVQDLHSSSETFALPVAEEACNVTTMQDISGTDATNLQSVCPPSNRQWVVRQPTLFYMPCCPRDLYAAVIAQNRAAGTLHNVCILGNSLRSLKDSNQLLQLLTSFGQAPGVTQQSFMQALQQQPQQRPPFLSASQSVSSPSTRPTSPWGGPAAISGGSAQAGFGGSAQAGFSAPAVNRQPRDVGTGSNGRQAAAGFNELAGAGLQDNQVVDQDPVEDADVVMASLLATKGAVVEVFAPDFSAHGVAVGLHLFPCIS